MFRSLAGRGRPTNASRLSAVAANDTENCENSASFVPKRLKRHPQITGYTSPSEQDADGRAISLSGLSNHDNGEELSPDGSWNDWPSGEKRLAMDRNYSRRNDTLGDEDFYDEQAGHAEDAEEEEDYLYYRGESLASRGPVHISRENQRSGPPGTIHRSRGRPSSIQRHVGHRPAPPILQTDRQRDLAVPNVRNSASSSGGLSRRPVQQRDRPQHWGKRRSTGGGSSEDEVDGVDSIAYDRSARLSCIDEEGGADSEFSSFFASQAYGRGGCYVASRSGRISMPRFADDEDHIYYFYGGAKRLPQQQVSTQKVGSGAPMNQV
ncbi:unnamed protein product [Protopolystoma xenopodis]|uniref:Uncharacterized protein n=1 Tax=Protopolystoma xenopodis TaxID=117903 RepID=A0A3S5CKA1_9PLAT|nr:unnamed protein product [Protopolystoma xenopodis]